MVTATRLRRLELWSALQCAGGRRLGIWTEVLAASQTLSLGLDSQLTVQVPLDDASSVIVDRWQVVRVWEGDTAWDEWIVTDVTRDDTSNVLTFSAAWPTLLLGRRGLVDERTPDGRVRHELDRVGLTPATLLETLVLEPLARQGVDWVQAGVLVPTQVRDLSIAWQTPLQVLSLLAETCGCELQFRRVGITRYAIDLLARVGADAPDLDVRAARNLLEFNQAEALSEHATVITPKGADIDGESATIAEAAWTVVAVSGATVTLADVGDGPGPIGFDAQLDGLQLELPSGVTVPILSSTFATQQIVCATAPTLSPGATVRIVDAAGDDLVSLPCPPAITDYGRVAGLLERPDLPGHRNLVPNPVLRAWSGAGTTPPDGWATAGTVVLSRLTTGPQITRGVSALQVVADAAGEGVLTPLVPITTTAERPFLSGYVTLWITSGTVRVELVATTGTGERVFPLTGTLATSSVAGQQVDLGLAGIDAHAAGITAARLRVVAHSAAATFIVESAQLTRSPAQLPFVEGSGGSLLWHATNAKLETSAVPRLRTTLRLVDLARLDPVTFGPDCTIRLGQTARVVLPRRGIDGTARVVQVEQNLLREGDGAITLSDAPQDLTGSLARSTWRARPVPAPPIIVVAGDVQASTAFSAAGALTILVVGPAGSESLRAAVSTSAIPSAATVDAATGSLRADGTEVAALTAPGPFAPGQLVYIAVRAYIGGVGTRVLQLTDAADAADAAQGPSLEVRLAQTDTQVTVTYAAIGTVTYRVNDVATTLPASPFVVARPAAGSRPIVAVLYCVRNGLTQSETIVIPAIGVNTVTPDLVVVPAGDSAFTISAFDPSGAGLTVVRRMTLTGCTAVGFTGPGPHVLSQGQTVQLVRPLATNPGVVEFEATFTALGNGRASVQRTVAPRDLTGLGTEVLSNPEFRSDLPRRAIVYDNGSTGLVTIAYAADPGENATGQVLAINKNAGGGVSPNAGGFGLDLPATTAAGFVADSYRANALYLVTLRARIAVSWSIVYHSNPFGVGGAVEWLTPQAGTGTYTDYVLRVQAGVGGTFGSIGFFSLSSADNTAAVEWRVARINWRDLTTSERQPVASLTAQIIAGGDADTAVVRVRITPATSASRVWLAASTETPEAGSPAVGVEVVNDSTWNMPRRAFRTGAGGAFFLGRTPGFEIASASVEIPEQGRDTVPLGLSAERVGGTNTTEIVRLFPTDPFPQGAGSLTLTLLPSTALLSPAGPLAMTSGSPVDVTITKPAQNAEPAIVGAILSNPNRVSAYLPIKIEPVRALVPGRIEIVGSVQAGADVTTRFRAFYADGAEATAPSVVEFSDERTPAGGGTPVGVGRTIARDTVNGWFTATTARTAGDAYRGVIALQALANTARTTVQFPIPTLPAAAPADTTPRIQSINVVNTGASAVSGDLRVVFGGVNLPAGGSYRLSVDGSTFVSANVFTNATSPVTIASTVYTDGIAPPSGKAVDRARGTLEMLDASGTTVDSLAIPYNQFWGII
jgi:hypothetical protein